MISDSEEIKILRQSVRDFAGQEIAPHVMQWDEAQHFPWEIVPAMADLGMLGAIFPAEFGGAGLSYPEYVVMVEELSRVDGSVGLFVVRWQPPCSGRCRAAF